MKFQIGLHKSGIEIEIKDCLGRLKQSDSECPKKSPVEMQFSKGFGSIVPFRQVVWLPSGYPLGMLKANYIHFR